MSTYTDIILSESSKVFLPGIHLIEFSGREQIHKAFDSYISDIIIDDDIEVKVYDRIPEFYTKSTWPATTNLKCWNCDRDFSTIPLFIPINVTYENDELRLTVDLENGGVICSKNCGFTRIHHDYPGHVFATVKGLFELLLRDVFGENYDLTYKLTRPKTVRIEYGGKKTMTEFIQDDIYGAEMNFTGEFS